MIFSWSITVLFLKRNLTTEKPYLVCIFVLEMAFCIITALSTAGGRLEMGLSQALSSRYSTISLCAWSCGLILLFKIVHSARTRKKIEPAIFLICFGFLLPMQIDPLVYPNDTKAIQEVAALSLFMGIQDDQAILGIYPSNPISVYGKAPLLKNSLQAPFTSNSKFRSATKINSVPNIPKIPYCIGDLEEIKLVETDKKWKQVSGWMLIPKNRSQITSIQFLNEDGRIIGQAVAGFVRPDLKKAIPSSDIRSGFRGYIRAGSSVKTILSFTGKQTKCFKTIEIS
jgi:hypothetical protein